MTTTRSLSGIRVLDFSMGVAGPHIGMLCARHGADVAKIESVEGDWGRQLGRTHGDLSAFAVIYNEGKRSLCVNLKDPEAAAVVRTMAAQTDVIIEAFRPGVMQRLGLDYAAVSALNPRVVYVSVSGFGQKGPMAEAPATDVILQAYTGLMYANRDAEDLPQRIDLVMIDILTGLYGFQAVATALLDIERNHGTGRHIDCSMMAAATAFQAGKILEDILEGGARAMYVPLGAFATADGMISLSVRRDDHFVRFCDCIGRPDLVASNLYTTGETRVERRAELLPIVREALSRHSTQELSDRFSRAGILFSKVNTYADLVAEEQVKVTETFVWKEQGGLPGKIPVASVPGTSPTSSTVQAPHIGEHSAAVLRDWGVHESSVAKLVERGVIVQR